MLSHAAPSVAAETGVVAGKVVDAQNAGVAGAEITLTGPSSTYRVRTNRKGEFAIVGVFADTYVLTVRRDGVVEVSEPDIDVTGDQITDLGPIAAAQ
jgi:hypothetical protein